eukprot:7378510-Prymnesium_polylepis.1
MRDSTGTLDSAVLRSALFRPRTTAGADCRIARSRSCAASVGSAAPSAGGTAVRPGGSRRGEWRGGGRGGDAATAFVPVTSGLVSSSRGAQKLKLSVFLVQL